MHHPLEWFTDWAANELRSILKKHFSLCLSGHVHEQNLFHSINKASLVECSAPPLFTDKNSDLGYAIITVSCRGVESIKYRQWTKHKTFVLGTALSNTDDGIVKVAQLIKTESISSTSDLNAIESYLKGELDKALLSFNSNPKIWIDPTLSVRPISHHRLEQTEALSISQVLSATDSIRISAPPQFGLTCLGRAIAYEAWQGGFGFWAYIDVLDLKPSNVESTIKTNIKLAGVTSDDIRAVILDSFAQTDKNAIRIIERLNDKYPDIPIILLHTMDDSEFLGKSTQTPLQEIFGNCFCIP